MVMFDRSPIEWAVRCASSHSSVVILSGQMRGADLVVEDLRSGARQRAQPGVHEPAQVVGQGLVEALGPLGDLEGGEAVDVDVGHGVLHGPGDVDVVVAVEVGVDAALEAHLGGAQGRCFPGAFGDLVERPQVRGAPQVERQRAFAEPAEPALEGAHVGVVDVAVVHVGDDVAHHRTPQLVGHLGHGVDLGAPCAEQGDDLVEPDLLAEHHPVEDLAHRTGGTAGGRHQHRRSDVGAGVPGRRAGPDLEHLDAVVDLLGGGRGESLHEHRAGVVATEALGVGAVHDREGQRGVDPALGIEDVLGVGGEPRGQGHAPRLGGGAEPVEVGPRPLGVDVVGGDGGDAPPSRRCRRRAARRSRRRGWGVPGGGPRAGG